MKAGYALVTGASSGIGLAIATELARHGHNLILVARRKSKLEQIAADLRAGENIEVKIFPSDLSVSGGAESLYHDIEKAGLAVDILINNAGRGNAGSFAEQDVEHMTGTLQLNMVSLTVLTRLFIAGMKQKGRGRILNLASIAGFMPGPGFAVYHATKAYVLSLSEALNTELKGTGVTVTASCPGPTESEFHEQADTFNLKNFDTVGLMPAEKVAKQAYEAMMQGQPFVIHGWINQALATSPKFMPRRWVPRIVGKMMKFEERV